MMRSIQNNSSNFFVKLLLGALALSFAAWGVGDMLRGGFSGSYALKAGSKEVSLQEYRDELGMRYSSLQQVMGEGFTPEIASKLGLEQQVISDLKTGLLVQLESEALGLRIPESEILKTMRQSAAFQVNGKFNKDSFKQALRRAGITEDRYTSSIKKEFLSKLLLQNFSKYSPDLTDEAKILYKLRNETRDVTLYSFSPKIKLSDIESPDKAALTDYHKSFGEQFRKPEYRKLAWVKIDKSEIANGITVEDETLMKLYKQDIDSIKTPEQREVSQLLYENKDNAEKAMSLLKEGKSFAETVKSIPPQNETLSLGLITGEELPSEARKEVMSIDKGSITNPIETTFGWHLFRVENIIAEKVPSFESQKAQLKKKWLDEKIEDAVYDLTTEIEDSIADNIPLEETAKDFNLTVKQSDFLTANGFNIESQKKTIDTNILKEGFKLQDEADSSVITNKDGDYILISISERKESYIPELKAISEQVESAWKSKQLRDRKREKASTIANAAATDNSKLNSDLFKSYKANKISRSGKLPSNVINQFTDLPAALRQEIFKKATSDITGAYLLNNKNGEYIMAKINLINRTPDSDANNTNNQNEIDKISSELHKQYGEDLLSLYINHLSNKYPVEINHSAISQLSKR